MSDELAPGATQDTPPQTPPAESEVDWRKRYEDLRPEYDRTTQELAEWKRLEDDEEARGAWLSKMGYELGDDDEEELEDEPAAESQPDPRVDLALTQLAEIQYERDLTRFLGDRALSDKGRAVVAALCKQGGNSPKALEQAIETWFGLPGEFKEPEPEKKAKAPHVMPAGRPASAVKDFSEMSEDQINDYMVERARALEAAT